MSIDVGPGARSRPRRTPRPAPAPDGAHVVADHDRAGVGQAPVTSTKAAPTARAIVLVELVGHDAADVVRLEDRGEVAHASSAL